MKAYRLLLTWCALLLSATLVQAQLRTALTPPDLAEGEGLGYAAATDGTWLVTSARFSRKAYVFTQADGEWTHKATLKGLNKKVPGWASKGFGASLSVDNGYIAAGVPESYIGVETNVGLIELFALNAAGEWELTKALRAPRPEPESHFGQALDLEGTRLIAGAPTFRDKLGQAFIYTKQNGYWEATTLPHPNEKLHASFGASVAISGDWAMVGAPGHTLRHQNIGALYGYQYTDAGWVLRQRFEGNRQIAELGKSVVMQGNLMAVGAYERVMLYTLEGEKWVPLTSLKNPDFGEAMSYAGHLSLSPNGQFLTVSSFGKAYIYWDAGNEWQLLTSVGNDATGFGTLNVAGDDFFLLNSPYEGEESIDGAVYIYSLAPWLEGVIR